MSTISAYPFSSNPIETLNMKTRRIFTQDEVIELVDPLGLSCLKAHVTRGARGNLQVLVYSQPGARVNLDPPQKQLFYILSEDRKPEE